MNTDEAFDPHVVIRKLAEAEWVRKSLPDFEGDSLGSVGTQSMTVPFDSLRVACAPLQDSHCWIPEPDVEKACWRVGKYLEQQNEVWWWYDCDSHTWRWRDGSRDGAVAESAEEALLRAAEMLLKETHA